MQAALCFSPSHLPILRAKGSPTILVSNPNSRRLLIRATALPDDSSTVDYYTSVTSVFPAEACETIGGEACAVEMFPEVKLISEATTVKAAASEAVDRDYLEYTNPKTVFPAEACDDLGGEFCEPEYQKDVY